MESIKKWIRLIGLIFLIILALSGIGIGAVIVNKKEQDYDNEVKTELVEGSEDTLEVKDVE